MDSKINPENKIPKSFVLGVSHVTASVELRDKLLFSEAELTEFSKIIKAMPGLRETVILSTCNRTEIYGIHDPSFEEIRGQVEKIWAEKKNIAATEIESHGYFYSESEAIRHLFRVIGSLDSMVLGEMQIFGQIKEAYRLASEQGLADFYLNHIFQTGIRVGKRIRTETSINEGAVSISFAAVELAKKVLGELNGKTVGVVGAGEMGELAAKHFQKAGADKFIFFNRTLASAEKLATEFQGEVCLLSELQKRLLHCDIVVSATGATDIVITKNDVQEALRHRYTPLFLIDIAAPRDIDPLVGEISNAFLFSIDDLKNVVDENISARKNASQKAMEIIEQELQGLESWLQTLDIVPTIRQLREKYTGMAEKEIAKWSTGQNEEVKKQMEALAHSLMNKFLHDPTTRLKSLGAKGEGNQASYFVNELFGLLPEERKNE